MVKNTLEAHRLPDDFAARIGRIVRAREGVVEVVFDPTNLPDPPTGGVHDRLPERAFHFTGGMDQVRANAERHPSKSKA